MGSQQGKNTLNNTKSNMVPPKPSGSTRARLEYPNTDEAEENYPKSNFRKMKEEVKHSLEVVEEKTKQKNWKKSINPLKKTMKKHGSYPHMPLPPNGLG